eukprot:jgi/Undpi1/7748/HiC_scaffold_23.g10221.m1
MCDGLSLREAQQDGWRCKDGWKSSLPMGEWHGVTTNAEGRVIALDLHENDLSGEIPSELGDLDALQSLCLDRNRLEGGIPKEFGKLKALKTLELSNNPLGAQKVRKASVNNHQRRTVACFVEGHLRWRKIRFDTSLQLRLGSAGWTEVALNKK